MILLHLKEIIMRIIMTRCIPVFLTILLASCTMAQKPTTNYVERWKKVDTLIQQKGLTQSALKEVENIYTLAKKEHKDAQVIKALLYMSDLNSGIQEDGEVQSIRKMEAELKSSKASVKNLLQSLIATSYLRYFQNNRWKFYDRTATKSFIKEDIDTWGVEDFHQVIASFYIQSLEQPELLKKTGLDNYDPVIVKGNARKLRPTLFDLLAQQALGYFSDEEKNITRPSYAFVLDDEKAFAPAEIFCTKKFSTPDSSSLDYHAVLLYQEILAFHLNDADPSAMLDADLQRLQYMHRISVRQDKNELYRNALSGIAKKIPGHEYAGMALFQVATLDYNEAMNFDPKTSSPDRRYALTVIAGDLSQITKNFPGTSAAAMSSNLLSAINANELRLETETVNIPGQAFLSKVSYRNLQKIHYRIIALNDEDFLLSRYPDDKFWKSITQKKSLRAVTQYLPDPGDKRNHSVEIRIDGLPAGQYVILASADQDFSVSGNPMSVQYLHVSIISYFSRDNHYFVLNRETGQPLANAEVQVWTNTFNYTYSRQMMTKKGTYLSNSNGYLQIPPLKESFVLELKWNNDRLYMRNYQYSYNNNPPEYEETNLSRQTFLFTDRSIYRPGQVIYFKGIMVSRDSGGRKSRVVPDARSVIHLLDVSGETVDSISLKTNEYGSFNGKFIIPENRLTGVYSLRDEHNHAYASFNVEEYKRPGFEVSYDPVKQSFRLGDTVSITGTVTAYAGNNLNDASVKYRVLRKTRFPWLWRFGGWGFPTSEEMEIVNGSSLTNSQGKFTIRFKAIPDLSVDKKFDPVFDYEINADVTDQNGETRSGETSLSIGYKALNLQLIIEDELMPSDSLKELAFSSSNFAGEFQAVNATVKIYALQSPDRLIRPRYWPVPDTSIMSRKEFLQYFPHDEYLDENEKSNWKQINTVFSGTDSLVAGRKFSLKNTSFSPGWYAIEISAKDRYGETVTDKKYVQLYDQKKMLPAQPAYNWTIQKSIHTEPGLNAAISFGTSADSVWMIRQIDKKIRDIKPRPMDKKGKAGSASTGSETIVEGPFEVIRLNHEAQTISIPVTEEDRGGFGVIQAFVKHNRFFELSQVVDVPWTNKDLNIAVESFRDKILPGSKETWTLKITGNKGEKVSAEILTSIYDASLDQFRPHNWTRPALFPYYHPMLWNSNDNFESRESQNKYLPQKYEKVPTKSYDIFLWQQGAYGMGGRPGAGIGITKRAMLNGRQEMAMDAAAARVDSISAAPGARNIEMGKFAAPNLMKDEEVKPGTKAGGLNQPEPGSFQTRKNFSETGFFFPDLRTNELGNVTISFTIPEALTRWKWQTIAHTRDLSTGMATRNIVTQKDLMIQPNVPRFVREGDRITVTARVSNLTSKELSGQAYLQLIDPGTNQPVDSLFENLIPAQHFTIPPNQNTSVEFKIEIPANYNKALQYRILAKAGNNSDGEENILPVLSNRILVTESMPMIMRGTGTKQFVFEKLVKVPAEGSLTHHRFTIEYSSNPAWYGVLALPYLMEYPYECAEQNFNRYYANALAASVANSSPKIRAVFEKWRTTDTAALISNLLKNQDLKSVLIEQTPWVLQARNESEQRRNIAMLFDLLKLSKEQASSLKKLRQMQSPNGGFVWFRCGPDDRFITQYIVTGIGHLKELHAIPKESEESLREILQSALPYLDKKLLEDYQQLIKNKSDLKKDHLNILQVQYLYMRSFFADQPQAEGTQKAFDFYLGQAKKFWISKNRYGQAMIALALNRKKVNVTATAIMKSVLENAIRSETLGMYWKENTRGYYWYESPIETQALLMEAFDEVTHDEASVEEIKLWLLSQKQVQDWGSTKATAEAVYALLKRGRDLLSENVAVDIKAGDWVLLSQKEYQEAGTGYFSESQHGNSIKSSMGNISVTISGKKSNSISWGSAHWQYFEDIEKITPSSTPLKLSKKFFIERNSDKGPVMSPVETGEPMKVGDKLKVRIELRCDRDMEYIHMKDLRASGTEPVNVLSQYKWQGGLGYYEATRDASTDFFFSWLPKGTWVFEYTLFVTHQGIFSAGITTIQCMYAPEFNAHSEGSRISIK